MLPHSLLCCGLPWPSEQKYISSAGHTILPASPCRPLPRVSEPTTQTCAWGCSEPPRTELLTAPLTHLSLLPAWEMTPGYPALAQAPNLELILSLIFLLSLLPISKFCQFYFQNRFRSIQLPPYFPTSSVRAFTPLNQAAPTRVLPTCVPCTVAPDLRSLPALQWRHH